MKTQVYTYSLLQYRHSQVLEEVINVGLLAWFPSQKRLEFIYPHSLQRISRIYPKVQERVLKSYLRSFEIRVRELNQQPDIFAHSALEDSFLHFISQELLPVDSSALQFASPRRSLLPNPDVKETLKKLYNLYFISYDSQAIDRQRLDDEHLGSLYKKHLRELQHTLKDAPSLREHPRFHFDYRISRHEGECYTFEAAWKNGTLNLVQPVSFDLTSADFIQSKALRYSAQFQDLEAYARQEGLRMDVLLARPTSRNLFKAYDNALRLLKKPERVRLIEQEDLPAYSEQTIKAINAPVE